MQMVKKTFYGTLRSRGKVLCARRGERPEVQRADLRERGFLLHTSARGTQADCWGRVGKEIFRGLLAVGSRLHPCPRPILRQQLVVWGRPGSGWGGGVSRSISEAPRQSADAGCSFSFTGHFWKSQSPSVSRVQN